MRLLLIILSLSLFFSETNAQNEKGDMSAGVSGLPLFFNSNENGLQFSGLALKGSYGVFLSDRISLENNLFYYQNKDVFSDGGFVESESFGLTFNLRYHIPLSERIMLFADLGAGFGSVKYYDEIDNPIFSYSDYNSGIALYTIGLGTYIKVYENLHFELFIPYLTVHNTSNEENIYGEDRGSLLYGALAGPNVGFRYFF